MQRVVDLGTLKYEHGDFFKCIYANLDVVPIAQLPSLRNLLRPEQSIYQIDAHVRETASPSPKIEKKKLILNCGANE